jgi:hypothetical protein
VRWPRFFTKFRLRGGRAGTVTARDGSRIAELEWEMLHGELDMVVYGDRSTWTKPERHRIPADDLRRLVGELAQDMHINIELQFADGSQVFYGRS